MTSANQWRRNEFESGGTRPTRSARKKYFCRAPPLFGCTSTISRFGERFRDGQYRMTSFLFAVFRLAVPLPRALPFVKVGLGHLLRSVWSRRR